MNRPLVVLLLAATVLMAAGCGMVKEEFSSEYRTEQLRAEHPDIWKVWGHVTTKGHVVEHMPKPAVRAAWGAPRSVSRSSWRGDIWHYDFGAVFFDEDGDVEDWSTR